METAEIFYTDQARLKQEQRNIDRTKNLVQRAVNLWETSTKIKINNIEELKAIVSDPEAVFVDHVLKEEKNREKELKKMFGERANLSQLVEQIYTPENFNSVKASMEEIRKTRWEFFTLVESQVILSQLFHDRLLGKCYYVAHTKEQKARLEYVNKMKDYLTSQVEKLLELEIKQDGRERGRFDKLKSSKNYYKNQLPVGLRFVGFDDNRTIEIDPEFIINGFATFIPELTKRTPLPEFVPIDYRVAYVRKTDGADVKQLIIEGAPIPTDWLRQSYTTLLPEIYNVINGKIVKTDRKGKRYPENSLVVQN